VRWLDRLLARTQSPDLRAIASLDRAGEVVEIEGRIKALGLLEDPLSGTPAVLIHYRARVPGVSQRYFGVPDAREVAEVVRSVEFVLRDDSGVARIVVEGEGTRDLVALHRELHEQFGVALLAESELLEPGDRVRVRGRVRSLGEAGSPHRREPDDAVVLADGFELI